MKKLLLPICVVILVALLPSCKKERKTNWDTEMLVPIATSSLTLNNLVKDSALQKNSDGSYTLSFQNTLYEFNLADQIINIPDTSIGQTFTLDSLSLPNQLVTYNLSLGLLAQNMLLSPDALIQFLGQTLINAHGGTMAIPPVNGFSSDLFMFDGSNYLQQATLSRGEIQVWINNYLPIPIENAIMEVRNTISGTVLVTDTIPYIAANDSVYKVLDISGKTIEGSISLKLVNLNSPGSNGQQVPIDTSNFIKLWVFATNLRASDAIAVFPSQDLVSVTQEVTQEIADRKLTYIDARQGKLRVTMSSSIAQPLTLTYILEGAYNKYGQPLKADTYIPAAIPGSLSTVDTTYDISGFSINLTGKTGTKFNTYTQTVIAHIDSTGQLAHITLADSLRIKYEIIDVAPNYIKGYAGRDTLKAIDSSDFNFLDIFKSGSIGLEDVKMTFSVDNGIGVDGQVKINSLTAYSKNNGSRSLTGSIVGQPLNVGRATDFALQSAKTEFVIDNSNSNIRDLLGILPNKLAYDVEVKTNTAGNTQQYRDFAYLESALKVGLNVNMPLSLIANNLVLEDTIDFNLSQTNTNIEGITDGIINVIVLNKYPIDSKLDMVIYDENWNPVDTLLNDQLIGSADLDETCRAKAPLRIKIPLYVDEPRMDKIKTGRKAVIRADFSTSQKASCQGQYLKIYSDYHLDITFTARFNYQVNVDF